MSEVRCKKHGWHAEYVECAACVAEKMAVYDAAMEVLRTWDEEGKGYPPEEKLKLVAVATDEMLAVCRQAKRGT